MPAKPGISKNQWYALSKSDKHASLTLSKHKVQDWKALKLSQNFTKVKCGCFEQAVLYELLLVKAHIYQINGKISAKVSKSAQHVSKL
jgi:hypothetical protein